MQGATTKPWARIRAELIPRGLAPDPGLSNFRIAIRAALVQPLVLAFGLLVLRNAQMSLFMVFAVFSLLVLANYGGSALNRLVAYVVTVLVGAVLVAIGSLASPYSALAAVAALVVVFCVEFAGVFSGYVGASRFPLLLAYVLAATLPAPTSAIPEQVAGWLIGGAIATAARVWLWPLYERDALRKTVYDALRSLAELIAATRTDTEVEVRRQAAVEAIGRFQTTYRGTPYRPAGLTRRDRALARLGTDLQNSLAVAVPLTGEPETNPRLPESEQLASAIVAVLEAGAQVLKGGPAPDLEALQDARMAHRLALDKWAAGRLRSGASAESVLEGLDHDHRLRVLANRTVALGAIAIILAGGNLDTRTLRVPIGVPAAGGVRPTLRRLLRTVRSHLTWTSPLLHTSVRAALGLALAILLARAFGLQHAFWVVLGTMSVLRSNALGTGRSVVQALVGTLLGFAVGGLFTLLFAHDPVVLWIALPVAVFLAAYAPTGISFTAGQAAFTVLLLIIFNLLAPVGWQVGLVRIEDIAVGTGIGLAAGVLLWPRGARSDYAYNLSRLYRVVAVHLAESISLALGTGRVDVVTATRAVVTDARERAAESFDQLLGEHSSKQLRPEVAGSMISAADYAVLVADTLQVLVELGYVATECAGGVERLEGASVALVASWFMLAERIDGVSVVRTVPLHREELRNAAIECLTAWKGDSPERGKAAIAVAWTREWIEQLDDLMRELDEPAAQVATSAGAPWWK